MVLLRRKPTRLTHFQQLSPNFQKPMKSPCRGRGRNSRSSSKIPEPERETESFPRTAAPRRELFLGSDNKGVIWVRRPVSGGLGVIVLIQPRGRHRQRTTTTGGGSRAPTPPCPPPQEKHGPSCFDPSFPWPCSGPVPQAAQRPRSLGCALGGSRNPQLPHPRLVLLVLRKAFPPPVDGPWVWITREEVGFPSLTWIRPSNHPSAHGEAVCVVLCRV